MSIDIERIKRDLAELKRWIEEDRKGTVTVTRVKPKVEVTKPLRTPFLDAPRRNITRHKRISRYEEGE